MVLLAREPAFHRIGITAEPARFLTTGLAVILGCARDRGPLLVFAAASVEEPLREIESLRNARQPGQHVELSFAASNVLAQQIEKTRAVDVFLSADEQWMQWLAERELIEAWHPPGAARQRSRDRGPHRQRGAHRECS